MTEDQLIGCPSNIRVRNRGSDYDFTGFVIAVFRKLDNGPVRCVVQNDSGILHIFSATNLTFDARPFAQTEQAECTKLITKLTLEELREWADRGIDILNKRALSPPDKKADPNAPT